MSWRTQGFADRDAIARIPSWLNPLAQALPSVQSSDVTRFVPIDGSGRHAAVLVLFGGRPRRPADRAGPWSRRSLRSAGLSRWCRRACRRGRGIDGTTGSERGKPGCVPRGVTVFGALPDLWVPVSDFVVSPILAWWHVPSPVSVQDSAEVSQVQRVAISSLVDPAHRYTAVHPSGYRGPGLHGE